MALYHLQVLMVSRSAGQSATAVAARRSGQCLMDQRTGRRCAPGDGPAPVHAEIVLPAAQRALAGHWALDRDALWNAAELSELAVNRRTAREYDIALPHELDAEGRIALAQAFAVFLADRYGCAVDTTVHAPSAQGDARNHHASLLSTTREVRPTGLGAKTVLELPNSTRRELGLPSSTMELVFIREQWARLVNEALQRYGLDVRVDHRSLVAQRKAALQRGDDELADTLDRPATLHLGPSAIALERRGAETSLGTFNAYAREAGQPQARARELAALAEEIALLESMLADHGQQLGSASSGAGG